MEIEQRYAIAFMHRGRMPANEIHEKLTKTYGSAAYKIGTVTYWIRQIKLERINLHEELPREKPIDEGITNAVKSLIEQNPFLSAKQIAKVLGRSPNTVINRLVNYLEYKNHHTRWVSHHLSIDQKQNRVECAKSMLTILRNENELISVMLLLATRVGSFSSIANLHDGFSLRMISLKKHEKLTRRKKSC